jgi:hypothetical protein
LHAEEAGRDGDNENQDCDYANDADESRMHQHPNQAKSREIDAWNVIFHRAVANEQRDHRERQDNCRARASEPQRKRQRQIEALAEAVRGRRRRAREKRERRNRPNYGSTSK